MKRKVKLFTSIASLCLAVALMAFGVYAATSATYHVTSNVTYASQVAVKWTGKYTVLNEAAVQDTDHTVTGAEDEGDATSEWLITDPVELTAANNKVTYEFTCTNKGGDAITVTASSTKLFGDANLKVEAQFGNTASELPALKEVTELEGMEATLTGEQTCKLVIVVTLKNPGTSVGTSANSMDITLTAAKKA